MATAAEGIPRPLVRRNEREVSSKLKLNAAFACLAIEEQRTCIHHGSLGDVKASEIYTFDEDRLVQVHISFKPDQDPLLRDLFVERFKAADTWTEPFETVGRRRPHE